MFCDAQGWPGTLQSLISRPNGCPSADLDLGPFCPTNRSWSIVFLYSSVIWVFFRHFLLFWACWIQLCPRLVPLWLQIAPKTNTGGCVLAFFAFVMHPGHSYAPAWCHFGSRLSHKQMLEHCVFIRFCDLCVFTIFLLFYCILDTIMPQIGAILTPNCPTLAPDCPTNRCWSIVFL